jgi:two-component system, NarL family, response regulator NreC
MRPYGCAMSRETLCTVVVAEDHAVVRTGLCLLLGAEPDMTVVGQASTLAATIELVADRRPDILILDLNLADGPSLGGISELAGQTKVVVLTMDASLPKAREAMQRGASAYVLKDAADEDLKYAVRAARTGETYLSPGLGAQLAAEPQLVADAADLTTRELEILRLIGLGHTNREIANALTISARTVESHRAHVQQKLGAVTRAELVRAAMDRGLLAA